MIHSNKYGYICQINHFAARQLLSINIAMSQKYLNFESDLGPFQIKLIPNNSFVDFWLDHFLQAEKSYGVKPKHVCWPSFYKEKNLATQHIIRILETINKLNKAEYLVPLPFSCTFEELNSLDLTTQQILNKLHRCATVATEYRDRWLIDSPPQFDKIPWDNDHFSYHVNVLNQGIHALEDYVITPHRKKFRLAWQMVEIQIDSSKFSDVNIYDDDVDISIPEEMTTNLRLSGYDVWIKKDILGKDFITAFADHDDPNEFDIRPPPMISGGLIINATDGKDSIYQSPEFIEWLGRVPNANHGSYPLGDITIGKELFSTKLLFKPFSEVKFISVSEDSTPN